MVLLAAAIWAGSASAQPRAPLQGPQLTPNYREADIRVVADQVQQVIGRPIIIDPRVRAQVTVLSNAPMSPDAFYKLFQSALEVHGFVALDSGSAIEIVPDANARFGEGDDYVSQAIVLENIGAAQLVPILRPLLPQSAHLAAHPASNSLIVADRPQNIERMMRLIRRMDKAGTAEIEVIALENASADEVVRTLGALNQAAQAAGGTPPVQVIADARTNSVLLSGASTSRLQYRALIAHLDTPSAQGGNTLVKYLNYADAMDLASKLQSQFGSAGGSSGAAKPPGGGRGCGKCHHGPRHDLGRRRYERARDQRARAHPPRHVGGDQADRHPEAAGRGRRDHRRAHAAEVGRARRDVGGRQQRQGSRPDELQRHDRRHRPARHRGRRRLGHAGPEPDPRRPHARGR